jgi:hypothetical protein
VTPRWLMKITSMSALLSEKAFNNDQSTGCNENFKLAMTWLSLCLSSHELCALSTKPHAPRPSRLLDADAEKSPEHLRLCSGDSRHGPYATLSHIWGRAQVISTAVSTIDARMFTINWKDLSRTFQDAVTVARKMNVRYP